MNRPTPDPAQEGNGQDAEECLLPSWEGSGVGSLSRCTRASQRRLSMNLPPYCQVLECANPLALSALVRGRKSGRGLPQSKTPAHQQPPGRGS